MNNISSVMPSVNSFSSALMLGTTLYRNQPGVGNKVLAQVGYPLITVISVVESIAASTFCIGCTLLPISSTPREKSVNWLKSSSFSIAWSLTDSLINPFTVKLVADEQSARQIAMNGNLMQIPRGAFI